MQAREDGATTGLPTGLCRAEMELRIEGPVDGERVGAVGVAEREPEVRHLRLRRVVVAVGVGLHAGDFGDGACLQQVPRHQKVARQLHAEHARPAVVAVLVLVHRVGGLHVVEVELAVQAERVEQAVVDVERERPVVHTLGVVALLYEQRDDGRK